MAWGAEAKLIGLL